MAYYLYTDMMHLLAEYTPSAAELRLNHMGTFTDLLSQALQEEAKVNRNYFPTF